MEWKSKDDYNWELYNIEEDRSEINNLSEKEPEQVAHMIEMWNDWAKEKKYFLGTKHLISWMHGKQSISHTKSMNIGKKAKIYEQN